MSSDYWMWLDCPLDLLNKLMCTGWGLQCGTRTIGRFANVPFARQVVECLFKQKPLPRATALYFAQSLVWFDALHVLPRCHLFFGRFADVA